jgi:hypothetical protein
LNVTIGLGARFSFGVFNFTVGGGGSAFSGFVVFRGADFVGCFSQPRRVRTSPSGQDAVLVGFTHLPSALRSSPERQDGSGVAHLPSRSVSPLGHTHVLLGPCTKGATQRVGDTGDGDGSTHVLLGPGTSGSRQDDGVAGVGDGSGSRRIPSAGGNPQAPVGSRTRPEAQQLPAAPPQVGPVARQVLPEGNDPAGQHPPKAVN